VVEFEKEAARARVAEGDELSALLYHPAPAVLLALLDNPALDEPRLTLLLSRKDLPTEILEEIGRRKSFLKSYAVKKSLLLHPRTPRLIGLRLLKELYLMDLVQFALSPAVSAELKRYAEEQIVGRLPQLPLGQKITLARRGPSRVAGALVAEGHLQVLPVALENPYLTEAQVLKALAREKLQVHVVQGVANHRKWSQSYNVRLALVRNASTPVSVVLAFLPHLTVNDLRLLSEPGVVAENLRKYLLAEVNRRMIASQKHAAQHAAAVEPASPPQAQNNEGSQEEEHRRERERRAHGNSRPEESDDET
jgi:ribosomal protein L12E/L44/L45/RPP1/RPP2